MKRSIILAVVFAAVTLVVWVKLDRSVPATDVQVESDSSTASRFTVLIFADFREAENSCGCAEVIRIARSAAGYRDVLVKEVDSRRPSPEEKRFGLRGSPSVLVIGPGGGVERRFEGESPEVIRRLRETMDELAASDQRRGGTAR